MNTYCNKLLVLVGCNVDGTKPSHDFNINWAPRFFFGVFGIESFINPKNHLKIHNEGSINFQE
jgi:hypothetical protein